MANFQEVGFQPYFNKITMGGGIFPPKKDALVLIVTGAEPNFEKFHISLLPNRTLYSTQSHRNPIGIPREGKMS